MAEWVRLSTRMFENRKIKHLLNQPKGAELALLWVRLLCLAGTVNDNGRVYVTPKVTYTPQTLAIDAGVPLAVVKKAWDLFQDLEMIEITEEGYIEIIGWEKHQNVEGLNKIREQTKERVQRYRNKQKSVTEEDNVTQENKECNVTCNVTKRYSNGDVTQQNKSKNKSKNKDDYSYRHNHLKDDGDDDKNSYTEIFALWEKNMMPLTPLIAEKLQDLLQEVGEAAVEQGVIAAVEHGARNFSYVQTVARNFASGKGKQQAKASAGYSSMDLVNELYGEGGQNGDNASADSADNR